MTEDEKVQKRKQVIELAERLGSVSKACALMGIDRTSFYFWKKRYKKYGLKGLENRSTAPKSHPHQKDDTTVQVVLAAALDYPTFGCVKLAKYLREKGYQISSPTIQKILIKEGLGKVKMRISRVIEEEIKGRKISSENFHILSHYDPCYSEQSNLGDEVSLIHDVIPLKEQGVFLQVVMDLHTGFVFAKAHRRPPLSGDLTRFIREEVMQFYREKNVLVSKVITDQAKEFSGGDTHPYTVYLSVNEITHEKRKYALVKHGYIKHFKQVLKKEFLSKNLSFDERFTKWLHFYNYKRSRLVFPTLGKTPFDQFQAKYLV